MNTIKLEINIGTKQSPNWQEAILGSDPTISMTCESPLWNDASTYSDEVDINVEDNRHILGNADEMYGVSIYKVLYRKQFRLWVCGIILHQGTIDLDVELEIDDDGNIPITLTSGRKTLNDLLDGVNCRDVDLTSESIIVGYTNNVCNGVINDDNDQRKNAGAAVKLQHRSYYVKQIDSHGRYYYYDPQTGKNYDESKLPAFSEDPVNIVPFNFFHQYWPDPSKIVRYTTDGQSQAELRSYVNTSQGYTDNGIPYCFMPICYQLYAQNGDSWEKQKGYQNQSKFADPGAAERPGSAPCFFVLYFVDLLFKKFGINIRKNDLKGNDGIDRLAFLHTDWHIKIGEHVRDSDRQGYLYRFETLDPSEQNVNIGFSANNKNKDDNSLFVASSYKRYSDGLDQNRYLVIYSEFDLASTGNPSVAKSSLRKVDYYQMPIKNDSSPEALMLTDPYLHYAIATEDNFPDSDALDVINGLESMFGAKFVYNDEKGSLDIILLRDVLSQNESIDLEVDDYSVKKKENHIKGFRLKYSGSSTFEANELQIAQNQQDDIVSGSDNTDYNYNDWDKLVVMNRNGDSVPAGNIANYQSLINNITCFDETCYYDAATGNAYRIKVNSDAEAIESDSETQGLDPSLFEVGTFHDVEIGDCSDNELVEEISIGFTPVIPNDINIKSEKEWWNNTNKDIDGDGIDDENPPLPKYAVLAGCELHPGQDSVVTYKYPIINRNNVNVVGGNLSMTISQRYKNMPAGWDMSQGFDSPLQDIDMGLTVGVLRGVSTDSGYVINNYNYDDRGGSEWTWSGQSDGQITSDSVDTYGNNLNPGAYRRSDYISEAIELANKLQKPYSWIKYDINNIVFGFEMPVGDNEGAYTPYKNDSVYYLGARIIPIKLGGVEYYALCAAGNRTDRVNGGTKPFEYDAIKDMYDYWTCNNTYEDMADLQKKTSSSDCPIISYHTTEEGATKSLDAWAKGTRIGAAEYNSLCLKLQARKKNPYFGASPSNPKYKKTYDPYDKYHMNVCDNNGYFVIDNKNARRGLYDMFYTEYATWLLKRKIAIITIPRDSLSIPQIRSLDLTKRYKIGQYSGYINKIEYEIDEYGISDVSIELYYI